VTRNDRPAVRPAKRAGEGSVYRWALAFAIGLGAFLAAGAGPARPPRGRQTVSPPPTARFGASGNAAEVPMELASNAVFVPVRIGGRRPRSWLLDTASPGSAADPSNSPQATPAGEAGQVALALPGVELLEPKLAVRSFADLGPWYGLRVGGVIGDDLLAGLVAEMDYARLSIELYDPRSYRARGHMRKFPIRWVNGLPTINARVRVAGQTIEGNFVVNTGGSSGVVVYRSLLAEQPSPPAASKTIPGEAIDASGAQAATLMRGEWIDLGPIHISQPVVAVTEQSGASSPAASEKRKGDLVAGWIGGGILRKFRVVLDFPESAVYLEPNRDFVFPIQADASGATITAAGDDLNQLEVRDVRPESPAAQAGLLPGDRIVLIDSDEASEYSLDQVRELLSQAGHSPVLLVERLGKRVRIDLHLQPAL
jgi:PDZ domain